MSRLLLCLASAIAVVCLFQIDLAQAGLVNQWRFEEGTGTTAADSVGGQDGTLTNMAVPATNWVAAGAPVPSGTTWALDFDGNNDHVRATGYKGITGTDPRSMSAWIKTTDQTAGIISWGKNNAGQKWTFRVQNSNGPAGAIRVEVNSGYQVGTTPVDDDAWHHVVATWEDDGTSPNANDVRLWVDGRLEGIGAAQGEPINTGGNNPSTGNDVRIGKSVSGDSKHLNGQIDEVRIYDHAMSRAEIRALAGLGADPYYDTVMATNPIAYWRLGEPSGSKAFNEGSLGSAADGTYTNGPILGEPGGAPGSTDPGTENASVTFDGVNDLVVATGYKGITGTNPRSVSAWIKTTSEDMEPIISWGSNNAGRKWTFRVQDGDGPAGTIRVEVNGGFQVGTTYVADGEWHHVAATWEDDGVNHNVNDARLWVDGVLQGVGASQGEQINTASNNDVRIGRAVITGRFFEGGIDEVQIHDRALSRSEIQTLAGVAPDPYYDAVMATNPIAYWRLGEPSGGKAFNEGSLGAAVDGSYEGVGNGRKGVPGLVATSPNGAVRLNNTGDDHINIPDNAAINDPEPANYREKSFEAWFNTDDAGGRNVIYEQGGTTNGFNLYTHRDGGDQYLRYGAWEGGSSPAHFPSRVEIDAETNYHAVSTYDAPNDTFLLYLNGAPVSAKVNNNVTAIPDHGDNVAIGAKRQNTRFDNGSSSGSGNRFEGVIDEVALYNSILDLRSIQTHYVVGSGDRLGITPGAALGVALNYDAGLDADGDFPWQDSIGSRPNNADLNEFDWDLDSADDVPRVRLASNVINGNILTHAYVFDGSDNVTTRSFEDVAGRPDRFSASFELVFKADDLTGQEVIFETGGNTDGLSFWLDDSVLHFDVKDDAENARPEFNLADLSPGQRNDFLHVLGVVDLEDKQALLYVNGVLRAEDATGNLADWTGGGAGDAGLGSRGGGMPFTNQDGFEGQIALLRFYPGVLSSGDVVGNFSALVPEPSTWILLALGGLAIAFARRRKR